MAMSCLEVGIKALYERGKSAGHANPIINSGNPNSKAIIKLFERVLSTWMKIWYEEITDTQVAPGNIMKTKILSKEIQQNEIEI